MSFVISSIEAGDKKGSRAMQLPIADKSPKENVQLYCQQLASASKDLQLNEVSKSIQTDAKIAHTDHQPSLRGCSPQLLKTLCSDCVYVTLISDCNIYSLSEASVHANTDRGGW